MLIILLHNKKSDEKDNSICRQFPLNIIWGVAVGSGSLLLVCLSSLWHLDQMFRWWVTVPLFHGSCLVAGQRMGCRRMIWKGGLMWQRTRLHASPESADGFFITSSYPRMNMYDLFYDIAPFKGYLLTSIICLEMISFTVPFKTQCQSLGFSTGLEIIIQYKSTGILYATWSVLWVLLCRRYNACIDKLPF